MSKRRLIDMIQWFMYMLILVTIVLVAVCGYKASVKNQNNNNSSRLELSYISNKIHEMDIMSAVTVRDDEYGDVLVLTDNTEEGIYVTRIYLYKGELLEEYSNIEEAIDPSKAQVISKTEEFSVISKDQLLIITTDRGESYVKLRTENEL